MRFAAVPLDEAEGGVLAHSLRTGAGTLRKGTVLSAADVVVLREAGLAEVTVARLDAGDLDEDAAAAELARAAAGEGVRVDAAATGRANLFAECAGVLCVERGGVDAFNRVDEGITLATLGEHVRVQAHEMVATVKIIPFAVPGRAVAAARDAIPSGGAVRVRPFVPRDVGVVATLLPGTSSKMLDKTRRVFAERLAATGSRVLDELRVPHDGDAVAAALGGLRARGAGLIVVFGASAIVDRADVVPSGIVAAGGRIVHFGMPVDPGNLLLVGELDGVPVIGAPGCARSPSENGFDWVLWRLLAGLPVGPAEVTAMGVGGLLMEIVSRPQPRAGTRTETAPRQVAAVVLAGGQSRRMGGVNKLMEEIGGKPLVRIAAEAALASRARPVFVVTGHEADRVRRALAGLDVRFAHNPDYADGLSTSLRAAVAALPPDCAAAVVCLADMPGVTAATIDALVAAHDPGAGALIVVPTARGKRGNPVLWSRRFFPELQTIRGDVGARHLIGTHAHAVVEVATDEGVLRDVDTPEALRSLRDAQLPDDEAVKGRRC